MLSLLLAGCCATVLYARVYVTFDRVRITAVTTERQASEGAVVVRLPDVSRLAGLPTALILNLRNAAPDPRVSRSSVLGFWTRIGFDRIFNSCKTPKRVGSCSSRSRKRSGSARLCARR